MPVQTCWVCQARKRRARTPVCDACYMAMPIGVMRPLFQTYRNRIAQPKRWMEALAGALGWHRDRQL